MARITDLQSVEDGSKPFGSTIFGFVTQVARVLPLKQRDSVSITDKPTNLSPGHTIPAILIAYCMIRPTSNMSLSSKGRTTKRLS